MSNIFACIARCLASYEYTLVLGNRLIFTARGSISLGLISTNVAHVDSYDTLLILIVLKSRSLLAEVLFFASYSKSQICFFQQNFSLIYTWIYSALLINYFHAFLKNSLVMFMAYSKAWLTLVR